MNCRNWTNFQKYFTELIDLRNQNKHEFAGGITVFKKIFPFMPLSLLLNRNRIFLFF
jgi:hypothetical protein